MIFLATYAHIRHRSLLFLPHQTSKTHNCMDTFEVFIHEWYEKQNALCAETEIDEVRNNYNLSLRLYHEITEDPKPIIRVDCRNFENLFVDGNEVYVYDCGINLYIQKERFTLLDEDGKPSLFAPVMIATLSTCAQLERDNISFRLNSGRKQYVEKGGKLGRPLGSTKTKDKKKEEYKEVISLLHKGYVIRDVARLTGKSISTVQRIKKELVD